MKSKLLLLCFALSFSIFAERKNFNPNFGLEESLLIDTHSDSDTLVVAFGGQGLKMGISIFEFRKILSNFDVKLLFVKDYQRKFYLYGLLPQGNTTQALAVLKDAIKEINPKRIVMIGNSAGGHAALLFGFLLLKDGFPIDKVHAFAPRFRLKDKYLPYRHIEPKYFKLKGVFANHTVPLGIFNIHYGLSCDEDVRYARKLLRFKWIEHHRYEKQGHHLIKALKGSGELYGVIKSMLPAPLDSEGGDI